ncbi:MAG: hypothetical protein M1820_008787 [Bogoriella megaspora]|nr:MAG: hypothetical protein M1820_008787 [Bogoriella megaspora]
MDITMKEMEEEEGQAAAGASASAEATDAKTTSESASAPDAESAKPTAQPPTVSVDDTTSNFETLSTADTLTADQPSTRSKSPSPSGTSTPRSRTQIPTRLAILDKSEEEARLEAAGVTEQEKELREKQKKKGLTKEQREELAAYERERQRIRDERVDTLSQKLIDRLSAWTETDKSHDVTKAFQEQMRLTVDNLKMESFGIEIMHAIGATYISKASAFIKSQKFLGIQGFWSRLKDKGTLAKETWGTISTAIDAQMTMEEMAKAEEKGGEDWTDERKAEFEKRVTGKILAAAWRGSKFEIQGVLRDVCDKVLGDKKVPLDKRMERAQGLLIIGEIFQKAARNPDEEGEYMAFEQLMAEAAVKKDKGEKKSKKSRKEDSSHHSHHHGRSSEKQSEASAQSEKA